MNIHWIIFKLLDVSTNHASRTELIKEMKARGHDVRLYCGYLDRKEPFGLGEGTIRYFDLPRIRKVRAVFYAAAVWRAILRSLLRDRPDVLLIDYTVQLIAAPLLLVLRAFQRKTRIVLDIRTLPVGVRLFRWSIKAFLLSLSLARLDCDGITFITEGMGRYCRSRVGLGRLKTAVWTSGFEPTLFDPSRYEKAPANGRFRLFYHGALCLSRGIGSLILAAKALEEKGLPVDLTLIGSLIDRRELLALVEENGLQATCRVLPPVPYEQVPALIMACDLPVIPFPDFVAWRVSSPIKLLEYMAMGKSMVVTDIDAHRDVLGDADFAFYAGDSAPESLVEAIERAYERRDDLERLGRRARAMALADFTWGRQAERLLGFFRSLDGRDAMPQAKTQVRS